MAHLDDHGFLLARGRHDAAGSQRIAVQLQRSMTRSCVVGRADVAVMITTVASPTRAKKRLGRFLTELRERAGRTLIDAATELKMSDSTTSRHESGLVVPIWSTVLTLLRFYGAGHGRASVGRRQRRRAAGAPPGRRDQGFPPVGQR
jgi:hypothetical protein